MNWSYGDGVSLLITKLTLESEGHSALFVLSIFRFESFIVFELEKI